MSEFQIKFKLKQHTPLIHFQHDQAGATLRATELKPKLDKFILTKLGNGNYKTGCNLAKDKGWLVGKGEHNALDYKVRIVADRIVDRNMKSNPLYFGNMGNTPPKYQVTSKNGIEVIVTCFITNLIEKIDAAIADFFAITNFGTRQGKGIGSFFPSDKAKYPFPENQFNYSFQINIGDRDFELDRRQPNIFQIIDLFYKALRSGINKKRPKYEHRNGERKPVFDNDGKKVFIDVFYFKSLLFLYFKRKNIQWEKKSIKEQFFPIDRTFYDRNRDEKRLDYKGLKRQQEERNLLNEHQAQEMPLTYSSNEKKLVKALLGLSSKEEWLSYRRNTISIDEQNEEIDRFKSPILFKVIENGTNYYSVYIRFDENIPLKGKWFNITTSRERGSLPLQVPSEFSLGDYFKFFTNPANFQIANHVWERKFQQTNEYRILQHIFGNLQNINQ